MPNPIIGSSNGIVYCPIYISVTRPRCVNIARTLGCVRNDSETHETMLLDCTTREAGRSRFYHIQFVSERNWDDACLMNRTEQRCWILWNMPFKGTRHGDAVAYVTVVTQIRLFSIMTSCGLNMYCDVTQCMNAYVIVVTQIRFVQHYDIIRFEHALWRNTMHEWIMNIHNQTWITQGRIINISRTPRNSWTYVMNSENLLSWWCGGLVLGPVNGRAWRWRKILLLSEEGAVCNPNKFRIYCTEMTTFYSIHDKYVCLICD